MSTTDFTPERSAAIRQLLIDTVADEPRRRKRLQILLTSILSGVAIVLAGGTAALALSGVIHLGGGETPPAPAPTPTQTVTPTPTPTPTATPTQRPLVQTSPVLPHDVDSLAPSTRWSLDLPGDPECTGTSTYTLSDARVVYVSGLRPKEYEGSDCINHLEEHIGVTLVDTSNGSVLWQREWQFIPKQVGFGTSFTVLGTSGRAILAFPEAAVGPHDMLNLATGQTVGTFRPDWAGFRPNQDMRAVPGDSGEVILLQRHLDSSGNPSGEDAVLRADPTDLTHPRWSIGTGLQWTNLGFPAPGGTAVDLDGTDTDGRESTRMLGLDTGEILSALDAQVQPMSQILLAVSRTQDQLTAFGPDGRKLWARPFPKGATVFAASTPETVPAAVGRFQDGDTGEFFVGTEDSISLIDQTTGAERWTVPTSSCFPARYVAYGSMLTASRDAFFLFSNGKQCLVEHETGSVVDAPDLPAQNFAIYGLTHLYTFTGEDDPGIAYDLESGAKIWSRDRHDWENWSFDGGYLVSHRPNHIESIG